MGIHLLALDEALQVVPDHVDLLEGRPEGAGGGQVVHVAQAEHVLVLVVLQGVLIYIQEVVGARMGETRGEQAGVDASRGQRVEVVVVSLLGGSCLGVLEGGLERVLVHFDQLLVVLHLDLLLLQEVLDELVGLVEPLGELVVGVHDGEGVFGGESAVGLVPVPDLLGQEERVVADLALEGVGRDAEEGVSIGEVVVPTGVLVLQTPPGRVVEVGEHGVLHVGVGTVEPFDGGVVLLESYGTHQVVVVDSAVVLQHDVVLLRVERLHRHILGVGMESVDAHLGIHEEVALLDALLLVDGAHGVLLVNAVLEDGHGGVVAVGDVVELSAQDGSHVAPGDHQLVVLQVPLQGLPLEVQPCEGPHHLVALLYHKIIFVY